MRQSYELQLVAHGQSGAEHVLLLLGDFRLADAFRDAHLVCRDVRDLIRLAVDADVGDRKSTRLNSSHNRESRMPSSA